MRSYHHLSETDLAVHYLQATGGAERMPDTGEALVASVEGWLKLSRLDHRLDDTVDIATEAFEIGRQVRAQAPAQHEAFQADVREGTTASDQAMQQHANELALAQRVRQMPMANWGAERERLGIHVSTIDHLAGLG